MGRPPLWIRARSWIDVWQHRPWYKRAGDAGTVVIDAVGIFSDGDAHVLGYVVGIPLSAIQGGYWIRRWRIRRSIPREPSPPLPRGFFRPKPARLETAVSADPDSQWVGAEAT